MSKISKYFQVTSQMLVCYEYDKTSDRMESRPCICYQSVNGQVGMLMAGDGRYHDNLQYAKFDDPRTKGAYVPGYAKEVSEVSAQESLDCLDCLAGAGKIARVFDQEFVQPMKFDKIRIYLLTGYVMNNIGGICVKVMAGRSDIETPYMRGSINPETKPRYYVPKSSKSILCNVVLFQERLKDMIQWIPNPLYMNGKFYDRCIEIAVPSAKHISTNPGYSVVKDDINCPANTINDILNLKTLSSITVEFETIDKRKIKPLSALSMYGKQAALDKLERSPEWLVNGCMGRVEFERDDVIEAHVQYASNSDNFNVRLTAEDDGTLLFYPVYGDTPATSVDVSIPVMNNIENGAITMNDDAFRDGLNEDFDADDFYDMYGDEARQWIIVADLILTYSYMAIHAQPNATAEQMMQSVTETKSYTIDYTNKTLADESFWRIRYKPVISERFGMECRNVHVTVNMRLINRYNGSEIIRSATMRVPNASSLYGVNSSRIDVSNIHKWKIVNKIVKNEHSVNMSQATNAVPAVLKSYYDSTELVVKDAGSGNVYVQGQMTLRLYHEAHNYKITLFDMNEDNNRIPYNLTGPYKYYLVFPGGDKGRIKVSPITDAETVSMANGELMFKISPTMAKNIMSVPEKDRYFALVSENTIGTITETSTLYEGRVAWINS